MSRSPVPIANLLHSRSLYGRFPRTTGKRIYSFIPHRLAVPLSELVASAPELATCILLGFSRTGSLIYSYNNNDDDGLYELQIWSIITTTPEPSAVLIGRAPLFKSINNNEIDEDDIGDELEIALFEAPGGRALVASAVSRNSSGTVTHHISLIPGAACFLSSFIGNVNSLPLAPSLGVEHFSYKVSNPFPRLRPACLTTVEGLGQAKYVLAVNTGTGVFHISFTIEIANTVIVAENESVVVPTRTGPGGCILRGQRPFPPLTRATVSSSSSTKIPKARICMVTFIDADKLLPTLVNCGVIDYDLRFIRLLPAVGGIQRSTNTNIGIDVSPSHQDDDASLPGDAHSLLCAAIVDHEEAVEKVVTLTTLPPPPSPRESSSDWAFVASVTAPAQRTFGRRTTSSSTGTTAPLRARPLPPPPLPPQVPPSNDDDSLSPPSTASPNLSPRPSTGGLLIRSLVMWRVNLFPSSSSIREQHVFSTLPAALQPGLDDVDGRDLAVVWRDQSLTSRVAYHGAPCKLTFSSTSRELNNDAFVRGRSLRTIIALTLPLAIVA
jgi:hypothetical protein